MTRVPPWFAVNWRELYAKLLAERKLREEMAKKAGIKVRPRQ